MKAARRGDPIPHRIFQTWKSKTELPEIFAYWRTSFLAKNPGYHFDLWDDADNRRFIAQNFAWFLPVYDSYPAEIYRADMVRYFYLYMFGGFYADLDAQCLKPLDAVLDRSGVVLGQLGDDLEFTQSIPNAIMASSPREEFWLYVIACAMAVADKPGRPEKLTGPILLHQALRSYSQDNPAPVDIMGLLTRLLPQHLLPKAGPTELHILPPVEWYPFTWWYDTTGLRSRVLAGDLTASAEAEKLFPSSSVVTYWTNSWFVGPKQE